MFDTTLKINPELTVQVKRIESIIVFDKNKLIPIENSASFSLESHSRVCDFLAQLYAALTYLSGPGDNRYDDYKGSYNFTFMLKVCKNNLHSEYIYRILHYRSFIDILVYEIVPKNDSRDPNTYSAPNNILFSDEDICYFSEYFCGYALGFMEGSKHIPKPFVKHSDSNLLLFGYSDGEYFTREFENEFEYQEEKDRLKKALSPSNSH